MNKAGLLYNFYRVIYMKIYMRLCMCLKYGKISKCAAANERATYAVVPEVCHDNCSTNKCSHNTQTHEQGRSAV